MTKSSKQRMNLIELERCFIKSLPIKIFHLEVYGRNETFYAGQDIFGKLTVVLRERISAKALEWQIFLRGRVITHGLDNVTKEVQILKQDAKKQKAYVIKDLEAGTHEIEFTVNIPIHLASTLITNWIDVTYSVHAIALDSSKSEIFSQSEPITIFDRLDLSTVSQSKLELRSTQFLNGYSKVYACCPLLRKCLRLPVLTTCIPRQGYVPHSTIVVTTDIETSRCMRQPCTVELLLLQVITHSHFRKQFVIQAKRFEGDHLLRMLERFSVCVPHIPPTGRYGSVDGLQIQYKLRLHFTGRLAPLHVTMPIIIGTVPVMDEIPLHEHI